MDQSLIERVDPPGEKITPSLVAIHLRMGKNSELRFVERGISAMVEGAIDRVGLE